MFEEIKVSNGYVLLRPLHAVIEQLLRNEELGPFYHFK